ncbi:hypothetical protein HDU96_005765 [Phlyctochytrium bullatum]|nr:hypothetical protein HDU96_005765 [Phlyctochytrium bullatum]
MPVVKTEATTAPQPGQPLLDQVRKNLQDMMEALAAYQIGAEGNLTPPNEAGGATAASSPARDSVIAFYSRSDDVPSHGPTRESLSAPAAKATRFTSRESMGRVGVVLVRSRPGTPSSPSVSAASLVRPAPVAPTVSVTTPSTPSAPSTPTLRKWNSHGDLLRPNPTFSPQDHLDTARMLPATSVFTQAWHMDQPWDRDLAILQDLDDLPDDDVDADFDPNLEAELEAELNNLGSPGLGTQVEGPIDDSELAELLLSKRGSNYFPTPSVYVPTPPQRFQQPSIPEESEGLDAGVGDGTLKRRRDRLDRLREVMKGLNARDVMAVVQEYMYEASPAS